MTITTMTNMDITTMGIMRHASIAGIFIKKMDTATVDVNKNKGQKINKI